MIKSYMGSSIRSYFLMDINMGNSTSDIVSRVSGMSVEQLEKSLKVDLDLLESPRELFSAQLLIRNDLGIYTVPFRGATIPKGESVPTDAEESLACSQNLTEAARDRHSQVVSNLISDISKNTELGIASPELTLRLKAYRRIFEAILRSDQYQQLQEKNRKTCVDAVPVPSLNAKAIKFGLKTLIHLLKSVMRTDPDAYLEILGEANELFDDITATDLKAADPILLQSINDVADFFAGAAAGKIRSLPHEIALQSYGPLFKIAELTESLKTFLGLANRFMQIDSADKVFWRAIIPVLLRLKAFKEGEPGPSNSIENQEKISTLIETLLVEGASEEKFENIPAGEITTFILAKLSRSIASVKGQLLEKKFKFTSRKQMFGIEITKTNIETLFFLQKSLTEQLFSDNFNSFTKDSLILSISFVFELQAVHLQGAEALFDETVTPDLKKSILDETLAFLWKAPEGPHSTQAILLVTSCFEIFYKEPESKLRYIVEGLERDSISSTDELPVSKQIKTMVFKEMSRPDKLFPALQKFDGDYAECVKKLYRLLIVASAFASNEILEGHTCDNAPIRLLETVQIALFAQASRVGLTEEWAFIIRDYSTRFLTACLSLLNSNTFLHDTETQIQAETLSRVNKTILNSLLLGLIDSLVFFSMDLPIISSTLPLVSQIFQKLSSIPTATPVLVDTTGIVEEVYESAHNYPDNANFTHLVEIPGATRYTLEFDSRFRTENNCDYLQLWLDKECNNRVGRWEGESYPRDPLVVNNPFLYFTFRSDSSANYWGWKITIRAEVGRKGYQKFWPEVGNDTMLLFLSTATSQLISGKFDATELPDDVRKVLESPFLKHGLYDRCLLSVRPLPKLNPEILKLVDCALEEDHNSLSVFSRFMIPNEDIGLRSYLSTYEHTSAATYSPSVFLQDLIEGKEELVASWNELKKKSSTAGGAMNIGGTELDQAERTIFAVFTTFFEIVDTMAVIFTNVNEAGSTVKLFVKESCNIRIWAQKKKQQMIDGGIEDASYKQINDEIVKKCTILLGSQYKSCLQELGVTTVLVKLIKNITEVQEISTTLKKGSKWRSVKNAIRSIKKLNELTTSEEKVS